MGTTTMAKVKAKSLRITSLTAILVQGHPIAREWWNGIEREEQRERRVRTSLLTHIGTAGAVLLDSWPGTALLMSSSSLSRMVFSVEMIRRVAIVCLSFFQ